MIESRWKIRKLIAWQLLMALMIASFIYGPTASLWNQLDVAFFRLINGSLKEGKYWQIFWACANHRMADWVEDVCILGFYLLLLRKTAKHLRPKKGAEILFTIFLIAFTVLFINRKLFSSYLKIPRISPTRAVEGSIRLSELVPWLHVKDGSARSFPGDHGTTAILFAASYMILAGWRLGVFAILYGAFLCLPRLFTGAHWLSDVIVGSGCIAIFVLSWAFCSPFAHHVSNKLLKILRLFSTKKEKEAKIGH
ncbi:MAG: phosphatase PAP2 family protein [Chlamydiales bacterium]